MKDKELLQIASDARRYSYSPYSKFRVGAALLTKSGKVYTGCNIENATFGATCCAERTAIFKAISEGELEFEALAVQGDNDGATFPCGICRQVMVEFAPALRIILGDKNGNTETYTMKDLLPYAFELDK